MNDLFQSMNAFINQPQMLALIEKACDECEAELRETGVEEVFRTVLPEMKISEAMPDLRSLWVFAFNPNGKSDIHKHSNSSQYTCNWRGEGHLKIGHPENAKEFHIAQQPDESTHNHQWVTIPSGTFHEAISSEKGWCVVSFQSVTADQLQCEQLSGASSHYIS